VPDRVPDHIVILGSVDPLGFEIDLHVLDEFLEVRVRVAELVDGLPT